MNPFNHTVSPYAFVFHLTIYKINEFMRNLIHGMPFVDVPLALCITLIILPKSFLVYYVLNTAFYNLHFILIPKFEILMCLV